MAFEEREQPKSGPLPEHVHTFLFLLSVQYFFRVFGFHQSHIDSPVVVDCLPSFVDAVSYCDPVPAECDKCPFSLKREVPPVEMKEQPQSVLVLFVANDKVVHLSRKGPVKVETLASVALDVEPLVIFFLPVRPSPGKVVSPNRRRSVHHLQLMLMRQECSWSLYCR